jgi:hypothetical protein
MYVLSSRFISLDLWNYLSNWVFKKYSNKWQNVQALYYFQDCYYNWKFFKTQDHYFIYFIEKVTKVLKLNQKNTNHVLNNWFQIYEPLIFWGPNVFGEFEMFFQACVFECISLVQFVICFYIFWNVHIIHFFLKWIKV